MSERCRSMPVDDGAPTDLDAIFLGSASGADAVLRHLEDVDGAPSLLDAEDFVIGSLLIGWPALLDDQG